MECRRRAQLYSVFAILTAITNFPSGFTNSSVNTAGEALEQFVVRSLKARGWSTSKHAVSLVQSSILTCWYVVQVFGAMAAPLITDRYGRKVAYLVASTLTVVATCVQWTGVMFLLPELLLLGRCLAGVVSPLSDASLILYLQECSPVSMRGRSSFYGEIGYATMCVVGMTLGLRHVLGYSLPRLLAVSVLPTLVGLIFLFFIPETPKYLMIVRKDREAARRSLEFFQGVGPENENKLEDFIREAAHDEATGTSSFREVLRTWHLRRALVLAAVVSTLTLPFYPLLQLSTYIFIHAGIDSHVAALCSMLLMITFACSTVVGAQIIDSFPRRLLVLLCGAITNLFLAAFVLCATLSKADWRMQYGVLAALFCYAATYGCVLGPLSWFVAPELVTQRHRATIFGMCFAVNNLLIAITNFATLPLYKVMGALVFVPLFIMPSTLSLFFIWARLPETRGKESHEIVAEIKRSRRRREGEELSPDCSSCEISPRCHKGDVEDDY